MHHRRGVRSPSNEDRVQEWIQRSRFKLTEQLHHRGAANDVTPPLDKVSVGHSIPPSATVKSTSVRKPGCVV